MGVSQDYNHVLARDMVQDYPSNKGIANAQHNLGLVCITDGEGVPEDVFSRPT